MNAENQLKAAVASIQDELKHILAVAEVRSCEGDALRDQFKQLLIAEFNTKLRRYKARLRALGDENRRLKEEVARLTAQLQGRDRPEPARLSKSESALTAVPAMAPPTRKRRRSLNADSEEKVLILSSPIKSDHGASQPAITSSQFNRLPTQYSDSSESAVAEKENLVEGASKGRAADPSPVVAEFAGGDDEYDRVVADSQDECEPLAQHGVPSYPKHYTALQRAEFLRNYYRMQLGRADFSVPLHTNPITDAKWTAADFKPNPRWTRPKRLNSHAGVMTAAQQHEYDAFFAAAGTGAPAPGPVWDDAQGESPEWVQSQVMDKYLLPVGYMTGDFVGTQEAAERKRAVAAREEARVARRLASALARPCGEFVFYEEVLNSYVAQGRFKV